MSYVVKKTLKKKHKKSYVSSLEDIISKLNKSLDINSTENNKEEKQIIKKDESEVKLNWLSESKNNIKTNDLPKMCQLLNKLSIDVKPIPDTQLFDIIGKHCEPQMYTILRNSNIFEDYFNNCLYFDTMIEGVSRYDNVELMKHLTTSHQLTHIHEYNIAIYVNVLIDNKAYKSLKVLCDYVNDMFKNNSSKILRRILVKSFETLDNKIISIILHSVK